VKITPAVRAVAAMVREQAAAGRRLPRVNADAIIERLGCSMHTARSMMREADAGGLAILVLRGGGNYWSGAFLSAPARAGRGTRG
jgi:hypothetical protein